MNDPSAATLTGARLDLFLAAWREPEKALAQEGLDFDMCMELLRRFFAQESAIAAARHAQLQAAEEALPGREVLAAARELKRLAMTNGASSLGAQMAERALFVAAIRMPAAERDASSAGREGSGG